MRIDTQAHILHRAKTVSPSGYVTLATLLFRKKLRGHVGTVTGNMQYEN